MSRLDMNKKNHQKQQTTSATVIEHLKYLSEDRRFESYWKHSNFFFFEYGCIIYWFHYSPFVYKLSLAATRYKKKKKKKIDYKTR